ncbi:MAG: mannose-1-phosphate guanylyltransferase/mannose-6-phosphate isomerase [Acidimicrobiia bacterium]
MTDARANGAAPYQVTPEHDIVPVILSGGMGTRLWPASRRLRPKQLLALIGEDSMIQATVDRVHQVVSGTDPIIVTNVDHADEIQRILVDAGYADTKLIVEPVGRNTAPAVAVAALEVQRSGGDLMLILPADHSMTDLAAFSEALEAATEAAEAGYLVTFGISPSSPETGYGYIKSGETIVGRVSRVAEFKEKPDEATAASYLSSGEYLWNSGMFLLRASLYLDELETYAPDIAAASLQAFQTATRSGSTISLGAAAFEACRSQSIDYAVMEPTERAAVIQADPGWSDVGSWRSMWEIADRPHEGNVVTGDVSTINVTNSYIRGGGRLIAAVGLDNTVIVDTPNAILVAAMDATQDVNAIVAELKAAGRDEYHSDGTSDHPWGRLRIVDRGPGYRVHHVHIHPGKGLQTRIHEHKSEHWLVVRGQARVTTGGTSILVPTGESVYIPSGESHQLENAGDDPLDVISVDVGLHVGDDGFGTSVDAHARGEKEK